MIFIELIGLIFVELVFQGIILGTYRLLKKFVKFIRVYVFRLKPNPISAQKTLEKNLLYKNIELTENVNSELRSGQKGAILEVINKDKVFAEFYDRDGKQIELNNNLVFEIGIKQFKLKK